MALCVLTAGWKMDCLNSTGKSSTFIDGLLAIVVDHGLRAESRDEANVVWNRVTQMGNTTLHVYYLSAFLSYDRSVQSKFLIKMFNSYITF